MGKNHSWKWVIKRAGSKYECLRGLLRQKQYVYQLISIQEGLKRLRGPSYKTQVSQKEWISFFERLHAQLAIGEPLILALKQVAGAQAWTLPIQQFIRQASERLTAGYFIGPLFKMKVLNLSSQQIGMLQGAEKGGYLLQGLARLKEMMHFQLKIRKQMQQNLIYPACVLGVAFIFGCVLSFFLLPRFETFIQEQQIPLNGFAQTLFMLNHYALYLCLLTLGLVGSISLYLYVKRISLWTYIERGLGCICLDWRYNLFAMDLSCLLENQIPLLESLKLALMHLPKAFSFETIASGLNNGLTLSEVLCQLPHDFRDRLQNAELQGTLPQTLQQISQTYYQAYELKLIHYVKWLEPVSLILIATFLLVTLLGLFYPLLQIFQTLQLES